MVAAVGLLALAGCPGRLDDPEKFEPGCHLNTETDILVPKCGLSGCHDAITKQNMLDLASPGISTRLKGMSSGICEAPEPLTKLMLSKISPMPSCGVQMPFAGGTLDGGEIECLTDYLDAIAADGGT